MFVYIIQSYTREKIFSMTDNNTKLINVLKAGGVAVLKTDTIYGIVGRAEDMSTVERIYELKKRAPEKPCIILISSKEEMKKFCTHLTIAEEDKLDEFWPGPVSVIVDCPEDKFSYLHRGTSTLAFRFPKDVELRNILRETGPIIAPSANPEGLPPARNITEAKDYFGPGVDIYADGGEATGPASKIIKLHKDGSVTILRA